MKDDGYIVVETIGAFVPFVLLVVSILSLVNIITLQVRLHYAMTQAAGTLSMYSYTLEAAGISKELQVMDERAGAFSETVDGVLNAINSLSDGGDISGMEDAFGSVQAAADNPEELIRNFAAYGLNEVKETVSAHLVTGLINRYLTDANTSGAEYLSRMKVSSFDLTQCSVIDRDDNVKLTANYEVEYTFGSLRLPFAPSLRISQTVVTKAWLGGSGRRYIG